MSFDLPGSARDLLIVLGVLAVLALASFALRNGRRAFHTGLIAAVAAYLTIAGLWALSPHSSWTNLLFQLFPVPAIDESARLIGLFVLPAVALYDKRIWIAFALGFAAFEAGAIAWLATGQSATPPDLLAPLVALSLHFALGIGALAMKARSAPPMLIFCVLALAHGGHNGVWIAATGKCGFWTLVGLQAAMTLAYAGVSVMLLRASDALRGEDRRID